MQPPTSHHQGRINLSNLKSQIAKQLGPDRTQMYFSSLNRLLAQKLSKTEFNKFCLLILGRENIPLHNKLIRSILRNAYYAKSPPPLGDKNALKQSGTLVKKSIKGNDLLSPLQTETAPCLVQCNGDIVPPSPRKRRTGIRDRKSPLGSNGRIEVYAQQSFAQSDETSKDGLLGPCDWKRPVQNHQSGSALQPLKIPCTDSSLLRDQTSLHSKGMAEAVPMEDGENIEESNELNSRRPLRAPLGVPFCPPCVGRTRRSLPLGSSSSCGSSNYYAGELCHTEDLRKWMEKVAEAQGMGVTLDCANLLNNSLDIYLKRLIKSAFELARAGPRKQPVSIQQVLEKPFNGIWPGNQMHVQSSPESLCASNEHRNPCLISLQDFQVAMELNPRQLGEDWPLLFEKICSRSFEA